MPGNYKYIFIGCDMDADYFDANVQGTYLDSGTCTYEIADLSGNVLTTGACAYLPGSEGNYQGLVPASFTSTLTEGAFYFLIFTFGQSGADNDVRTVNLLARNRGRN